ncbi:MAG: DNA alkylation repair protein [Bdellovibrionaceae bacterium]|nr:DNA alkylation repair protein [Pseudobdellovibrionaceae bacterium]
MASALKNLVGRDFIRDVARALETQDRKFDARAFIRDCDGGDWDRLELKARTRRVATQLGHHVPGAFPAQLGKILKVAGNFSGLAALTFPEYVEQFGLKFPELSLPALKELTVYSTSEFGIRPFLREDLSGTLKVMKTWARDPDERVRRLASEGCRPRLPWSFPLKDLMRDPAPVLPILERLKDDESLFVRKSVANHLNDISKDHPELVLRLAKEWIGQSARTDWILKHALRTLLKKGDQRALKLFGVAVAKNVEVRDLKFTAKAFRIGGRVEFSFALVNEARSEQNLRLEYAIHYVKKTKGPSKKVFKISERPFAPGPHALKRSHSLRQMTTREHLPGRHELEVIVNGVTLARGSFQIKN